MTTIKNYTPKKIHYVYEIHNIKNDMKYIGVRSTDHLAGLDLGFEYFSSSSDKEFIQDQKNNPDNYIYKVIEEFETRLEAAELEIELHDIFDVGVNPKFYNRSRATYTGFSMYGMKHSAETKKKISNAHKGNTYNLGRTLSEAHKLKLSNFNKGKTISEAHKIKIGIANKGNRHSEASKNKMSESSTGKTLSDATKLKISNTNKGRKKSEAHKIKIGIANKGKTLSEASKNKISKNSTYNVKVSIDGIEYSSINDAALALGVNKYTMVGRFKSTSDKFKNYIKL